MSRAKWKFPLILRATKSDKNVFVSSRNLIISPSFVNKRVYIYNGKTFNSFLVPYEAVGHKFGEFSPTKKKFTHKKKK